MNWKHILFCSCLAVMLAAGGEAYAYTPVYLYGNTNYPMISDTAPSDHDDGNTGVFLDVSSITITDVKENEIDLAAILLNVVSGSPVESKTVDFKLDAYGQYWTRMSDGSWMLLPDNSDDPFSIAAILIREDMTNPAHRPLYEKKVAQIIYEKTQKKIKEQAAAAQSGAGTAENTQNTSGSQNQQNQGSSQNTPSNASGNNGTNTNDDKVKVEIVPEPSVSVTITPGN